MHDLNHLHLLVTAHIDRPPLTAQQGQEWLLGLVELIDMQILMDAQAIYCEDLGNEGVTGVVGLTTSHASFHAWHEVAEPFIQIDVYSCREFDHNAVFDYISSAFGATKLSFLLIDRNDGINQVIEGGVRIFEAEV